MLNQCYDYCIGTYPMSEEQLNAFLEKVKADTSLQSKLKAAKDTDAVVAIAKAAGFLVSAEELLKKAQTAEISNAELEAVSGGGDTIAKINCGGVRSCFGTMVNVC